MKFFNWFFAIWWLALAIAAFCGVEINNFTIGCGLLVAALGNVENALRL